jgi:hypothetical protein
MNYIFDNIEMEGNIDLNTLHTNEENYKDATERTLVISLDLDFVM